MAFSHPIVKRVLPAAAAAGFALWCGAAAAQQTPERPLQVPGTRPSSPAKPAPATAKPQPAQPSATAPQTPAPSIGAPWATPPLHLQELQRQRAQEAAKKPLTPERLRPAADILLDCKTAPPGAVTQIPEPLSRWATVYCTKNGHIFSSNDRYFSAVPGAGAIGAFSAAALTGRRGEVGHAAHFTKITYDKLPPEKAKELAAGVSPEAQRVLRGNELFQLNLTVDTGKSLSMVVVDPNDDPFWVIPLVNGKLRNRGFYVASLDYVNKKK
jgi:hypothetical protein